MNREIKFRGKCAKSGDWVYGDLIHGVGIKDGSVYILPRKVNLAYVKHCDPLDGVRVKPETVGQYTGLKDKDGNEIYEGDIVMVWHENEEIDEYFWTTGVCEYSPAEFYIRGDGHSITCHFHYNNSDRIIIGTIHDNPELIK